MYSSHNEVHVDAAIAVLVGTLVYGALLPQLLQQ